MSTSMPLTEEDMWGIESILCPADLILVDGDIEKDLDFLAAAPPNVPLAIDTSQDALMDQAFAFEPCFSPQSNVKPRHSLDMMTLEPIPLDVLTFVSQPSKRKSVNLQLPPYLLQPKAMLPTMPAPTNLLSPTGSVSSTSSSKSPKKCKQCIAPGCTRRAQSNNRCKSHGGGARCTVAGCGKSSQGGGLCRAHGGGKKCKFPGCTKGTQRLGLCYLHGGIRRCTYPSCVKKDRGNGFCISHGGGKKCSAPKCTQPVTKGTTCAAHGPPPLSHPVPVAVKIEPFVGRAIVMP